MTDQSVVDYMVRYNGDHNFKKAIEELMELALVLMQKLNKPIAGAPEEQEIIDEIGDVEIRMEVLKRLFPKDKIDKRITFKMDKFRNYIETKKYSKF
jgi:hypothetical protein